MAWTLHQGDCLDVLPTLADASVDAVITDPPYHRVKGEAWDRQWRTDADYLAWLGRVADQWRRVLKPNGSLYCFASPRMAARVEVMLAERFTVLNRICWSKPPFSTKAEMNAKDGQRCYFPTSEYVIFAERHGRESLPGAMRAARVKAGLSFSAAADALGCNSRLVDKWETQRGERDACEPSREQFEKAMLLYGQSANYEELRRPFSVGADVPCTDVWTFPTVQAYPGKHPCEKPLAMLRHMVRASTRPGAVVLDCFAGSGSLALACEAEGRDCVLIEREPAYCEAVRKRMANQTPLFAQE